MSEQNFNWHTKNKSGNKSHESDNQILIVLNPISIYFINSSTNKWKLY